MMVICTTAYVQQPCNDQAALVASDYSSTIARDDSNATFDQWL